MIPFQFSALRVDADGAALHHAFLDLSGEDPSRAFPEALAGACTGQGPVFVYNAGFETARIADLAQRFPEPAAPLLSLKARVVDLEAIAPGTEAARERQLAEQLLEYCRLDTLAMLRLWEFFRGAAPPAPDGVGERILQNPELVRRILESDAHAGEAQTVPEFLAWLASVKAEPAKPD